MFTVRFYWNSSEYRQIFIVAVVCGDIMSLHSSTLCWLIIFFIQLSHMFLAGFFLIDFLSSQAISLSFSSFSHKGRYPTPIWETPSCVTVRGFLSGIFVLAEWQSTVHLQTWVKFFSRTLRIHQVLWNTCVYEIFHYVSNVRLYNIHLILTASFVRFLLGNTSLELLTRRGYKVKLGKGYLRRRRGKWPPGANLDQNYGLVGPGL